MIKVAPSIRQVLVVITTALTLMIGYFAGKDIYVNWVGLTKIETLSDAWAVSDTIFAATEKLSLERDVALSMLHVSDREIIDSLQPRLMESRQQTDKALTASLDALNRFGSQELVSLREKIAEISSVTLRLRPRIDEAVSIGNSDEALAKSWSDEATRLMLETDTLWMGFARNYTDIDPQVTLHLRFKRFLRIITDYTGRERSLIGQLIADRAYPTTEDVAELQRGQGIVALSWQISREVADQSRLYPVIAADFEDALSHHSTMSGIVQAILDVPQARTFAIYPIGLDLWFELSTQASDSFGALRDASIQATRAHIDRLIATTQRNIAAAVLVFIPALLLCGYSFWTITRRVIRPINQVIDALLKVMQGETVSFAATAHAQDEIGKLAVVLHAFQQNMEEVKRTAGELDRSQRHLRAVVDNAVDGLITIDAKGIVKSFNPACEKIFGYGVNEVIGQSVEMLVPESYREEYGALVSHYLATGEAPSVDGAAHEFVAKRKNGTIFPIDLSISAFTLHDGAHFSGIVRDITARKEAYRQLTLYTRALERSNKELDEFAYIASHDLKEPLRGIHNHSRFLLEDNEDKLDEDSVGRLKRLTYLSQRMERLVNDLLYFSRIGRQDLSVGPTDLNAVIQDIGVTLETFLAEHNARIAVPRPLPLVTCDKIRVAEVLRNLITNAVKYSDAKERIVEIGCQDAPPATGFATTAPVFYVRDNGRGIAPEFHEDIFRMFKRLQKSSDKEEGTGVGLTFVKKIIERHGGRIWLESELGKGTTFYFTLEGSRDDKRSDARAA